MQIRIQRPGEQRPTVRGNRSQRKAIRISVYGIAAALAFGIAANAGAQTVGYSIRTGDVWVDNRMGEINDYGYRNRDPFVSEMVTNYGVPRPYVEELLVQRKWSPGDVYYACALAHSLGRPCSDVVAERAHDRGQGWGVTAMRLGIKPGSKEFFALKNGVAGTYGRWGHPIKVDSAVHVRWGDTGKPAHPGQAKHGKIKQAKQDHGPSGNQGKGGKHGNGGNKGAKGNQAGEGNGGGHGHGNGKGHGK
jgi:hypothetical protein